MNDFKDMGQRAQMLFDAGDYKQARALARSILSAESAQPGAHDTARKILKATGNDPAAVAVFVLTFATLAFLVIKFVVL